MVENSGAGQAGAVHDSMSSSPPALPALASSTATRTLRATQLTQARPPPHAPLHWHTPAHARRWLPVARENVVAQASQVISQCQKAASLWRDSMVFGRSGSCHGRQQFWHASGGKCLV